MIKERDPKLGPSTFEKRSQTGRYDSCLVREGDKTILLVIEKKWRVFYSGCGGGNSI